MTPEANAAESGARAGEPSLRALFDALPAAVVALDRGSEVIAWNPAAERMFGWTAADALGRFPPLCPAHDLDRLRDSFAQSLQGRSIGPLDLSGQTRDGRPLSMSFSSSPVHDPEGNITGALGIFFDRTQQKHAEQRRDILGRLATRLAACVTVEGVLDVVREETECLFGWDCHYFAVRRSDNVFEILSVVDVVDGRKQIFPGEEWTPDSTNPRNRRLISGQPVLINRAPGSSQPDFRRIGNVSRLSASIMDAPVCSGDLVIGAISAQSYTSYRYGDDDLRLLQQVASIVAPTLERVRAEESLRRREDQERRFREQLTALIEIRDELLQTRSRDDLFRRALELGRCRLGFDRLSIWIPSDEPGQLQGTFGTDENGRTRDERERRHPIGDIGRMMLAASRPIAVLMQAALNDDRGNVVGQGSKACAAITDGQNATGLLWADTLASGRPLSENDRELLALYASSLGVLLSHQRAEEELACYHAQLEELVEQRTRELAESRERLQLSERLAAIGTLAAGIAHEINNPIGMALLAAENAMRTPNVPGADEVLRHALAKVAGHARRCGHIVQSVLQFARQQPAEKWPNDLNDIVQRVLEETAAYAAVAGVATRTTLADDLPLVIANPVQIEQAVANLVRNAVEAGAHGGWVWVRTEAGADAVRVIVEDNGRGMTPEQKRRAFDPFFTTRQRQGGTGLGLSICHGIITEHAGIIDIQSQLGCGTTVTVTLPAGPRSLKETSHAQGAGG